MKRSIPLYLLILIGMAAGILFGIIAVHLGWHQFTNNWIKPWGTIFINLLKLIAIPLIIVSLINGISGLDDVSRLSRIGFKTMGLYLVATILAVSIGLIAANLIRPGNFFTSDIQLEYSSDSLSQAAGNPDSVSGPLQFIVNLIPDNIFDALTDNSRMLQIIFFSLLFGISIVLTNQEKTRQLRLLFESLNEVVMRMIHLIMYAAPIGVFALIASITTDLAGQNPSDTYALFGSLGMYTLTVILGLVFLIFIVYPVALSVFTNVSPRQFFKAMSPAQLLAFSTSSSAATLPMTMQCCEENLGLKKEVTSFVLPLGATINMDGTSLYQAVAAIFLAQIYQMDLSFVQQLTIILTATLASIGSAAVPGAGMIMLVIVLSSVGIPTEGIALIFAVDRPLDMLRTVVNITGDSVVASIVNISEKQLDTQIPLKSQP
ncbi:MAG: dicarboxylate/amino acid:cation symporter [Bacteroidales bacterium]|jgi:Na+/H+-dicarboxylate symporter|nr:dicarboxylate/amino acid:cation symporter [Bacteroidales bacterium]MDD3701033.1 dicarboxylate/amino acid:cation symporter [Bacteroidales bacterium]